MFRFLFIIYLLPNIYVFFRLRRLFLNIYPKKYFSILYILLACVFPLAEIIMHSSLSDTFGILSKIGFFSLPYFLYLFLGVIILDIILIINRFVKNHDSIITNDKLRKITLTILLIVPMIIVAMGAVHHGNIQINNYSIEINRKSSNINNLKIAFTADAHLTGISDKKMVVDFVSKINSLTPDIVLIVGDLVEGDQKNAEMKEIEKILKQINSKYGVYAVFGNHESHGGENILNFFSNSGIIVLQDASVKIDDSFYLIGRNDSRSMTRRTIKELLEGLRTDLPIIMLDHRPSNFDCISRNNIDVQISGHTHNGQLFPVNFITSYIYDLSWGHKKINNTHFFVTSGLQSWGPAVKTIGDSEIMVIDIHLI